MVSIPENRQRGILFAPESVVAAPALITELIAGAASEARPLPAARGQPMGGYAKRLFDVVVSALMLLVLAPLMLVVAGLVSFLAGPAIVSQQRVGFGGRHFTMLTFRTTHAGNARATCLSNVLRQSGLNELPQLVNVLKGDMSLVGPQPLMPEEIASCGRLARHYRAARPGLTGLWQPAGPSAASSKARMTRDRLYVSKWSLGLDAALLAKSVLAPLNSK
jgi:exopolysaccharide production protein ExoY